MKFKHSVVIIALLSVTSIAHAEQKPLEEGVIGKQVQRQSDACKFDIKFSSESTQRAQQLKIAPNVNLNLKQFIATKQVNAANISSNVICQQLIGQSYTGSEQEWQGFIKNGLDGLLKAGFKELQYTKVGTDDAVYQGGLDNMEYIFTGTIGVNKQIIHNLAVLDKKNNQVITLSVSGNEVVSQEIKEEYQRLIGSFSL
ncbi:hypothetical protein ORJ66_11040 [Pseudoalteromonas tunicata]|uniref:hypothetical protein n=1 Tax=Pseudoalteromonas tunicata TaxID=314281 RepID=UPI00273DDFFB|nr:hypothetical protein [Pseudoalteromonas tunicata]MDP5213577.1 hypothetical protein [Pseudoalteromonas tunicata]